MAAATGSPCGACKFLRRKCTADCIFAPYFCSEQDPSRFASIHKVFGASNLSKLLLHLPPSHRCDAVAAIAYEAQARITDPVYGCVSHIVALQQQVAYLQAQLVMAKAQLSQRMIDRPPRNAEIHPWFDNSGAVIGSSSLSPSAVPNYTYYSNISINDGIQQEIQSRDESLQNYYSKKI